MSIMGTGVAAGVAQTALQAQQVAREKDKQTRDAKRAAEAMRDRYDGQLKVLEEVDEGEASPRVVVDDQMQDHHAVQDVGGGGKRKKERPGGEAAGGAGTRLDVTG